MSIPVVQLQFTDSPLGEACLDMICCRANGTRTKSQLTRLPRLGHELLHCRPARTVQIAAIHVSLALLPTS